MSASNTPTWMASWPVGPSSRHSDTSPNVIPIRSRPSATTASSRPARAGPGPRSGRHADLPDAGPATPRRAGHRRPPQLGPGTVPASAAHPRSGPASRRCLDQDLDPGPAGQPEVHRLHGLEPGASAHVPERHVSGKVNPPSEWVWSPHPTHEPLVTKAIFDAAALGKQLDQLGRAQTNLMRQLRPTSRPATTTSTANGVPRCNGGSPSSRPNAARSTAGWPHSTRRPRTRGAAARPCSIFFHRVRSTRPTCRKRSNANCTTPSTYRSATTAPSTRSPCGPPSTRR